MHRTTHLLPKSNLHTAPRPCYKSLHRLLGAALAVIALLATATLSTVAQSIGTQWGKPIDLTQPSSPAIGTFPVLLCDQYQNAYVLWSAEARDGAAIYYRRDSEGSWSLPRDVVATSDQVAFGLQAVISNKADTLHAIWLNRFISGDLLYSASPLASSDKPKSWSAPTLLATAANWAAIQADSDGIVHIIYGKTDRSGLGQLVYHIQSSDNGLTWSEPVTAYSTTTPVPSIIRPEVAIDGRNRIHVGLSINSNEYGAYSEVGYIQSADGGLTWSAYKQVANIGTTFQGVAWIAPYAFGSDEVHLTWHDPRRMHLRSVDGGNTWRGPDEIMSLAAAFGGRNQLVKDGSGVIHAVTAVGDGVYTASWNGVQWSKPEQIDDRFIDPHGQTILACQGDQLHVAYYDRTGDNKIWYAARLLPDTTHIKRAAVPVPTLQPTASTSSTVGGVATPSAGTQPNPTELAPLLNRSATPKVLDPLAPVIGPTVAAAIVIAGVFIWRRFRSAA